MTYEEPKPEQSQPTFIGIHTRDESTQILYISSGVRQALGYTPAQMISHNAKDFIADTTGEDYPTIYADADENDLRSSVASMSAVTSETQPASSEENEDDEANAYVFYIHSMTASGRPILERATTFKCDNCVLFIGMVFPEVPFRNRNELEVQMLDGAMKRLNITRQHEAQIERRRALALQPGYQPSMYCARSKQVKAAFVLEHPQSVDYSRSDTGDRLMGPLVAFVTGSVSHLVEADTSDIMRCPFLKLVAPEDVLHVCEFFERLSKTADVQFETFALLKRPHIIEGDVFVSDEENPRVVVECLGAAADDGVVLLLRKLRTVPSPKKDSSGNYIHSGMYKVEGTEGHMSLSELISSDPETSDAPDWSHA
ncbi:hypothetical protein H4R20_001666 [Coemansia guatemalensis]|uniref:PAS domain-containing protein n=1 Tax=Coemansia guatemalensis TaxID=2761395 RepID=A0A9W8LUQ4_9FUNG|nr:hypothetical protein H4R20_001666 [Coemansia guatemalensis]